MPDETSVPGTNVSKSKNFETFVPGTDVSSGIEVLYRNDVSS